MFKAVALIISFGAVCVLGLSKRRKSPFQASPPFDGPPDVWGEALPEMSSQNSSDVFDPGSGNGITVFIRLGFKDKTFISLLQATLGFSKNKLRDQ